MRLLLPVALAISAAAQSQPAAAPITPGQRQIPVAGSDCPKATPYLTHRGGKWQDQPVQPRKLGELPPADSFAAVVRTDERGCLVPVKYRDIRR